MTKKKVPSILDERSQALEILRSISRAIEVPGRRVTIERTEGGWKASLDTHTTCAGSTMTDALAQLGTVINAEAGEVRS